MTLVRFLFVVSIMTIASIPAYAAKNAWRQCGIGAMIFPKTGWAAATSNIIWDLGTTATTSSSSSESQCAGRASTAAKYIHQNYALLEEETAIGHGDHLVTVLNILDCKKGSHDKIIESVRSKFKQDVNANKHSDETYFNNLMDVVGNGYPTQCQTT